MPLLAWCAIVQIVMVLAVLGVSVTSWASTRAQQARVAELERNLHDQIARLDEFTHTPPSLPDLRLAEIDGRFVKFRPLEINVHDALDRTRWSIAAKARQHAEVLPVSGGRRAFDPWTWSCEARRLCERLGGDEPTRDRGVVAQLEQLVATADEFRVDSGDATFYLHPVATRFAGHTLAPGWVGAIGQAGMLSAFVQIHRALGSADALDRARRVFASFSVLRDADDPDRPWFAFADDAQYLWFESFPIADGGPQPRVLSGHLHALEAIYAFHGVEPSPRSRELLLAGMTTMQRYFKDYRRAGQTNRYCLLLDDLPDDDPKRSIEQQKWLYDVTGDRLFKQSWMAFLTDMPL